MDEEIFRKMERHALSAPNREVCGFVYSDRYVPITNLSLDPNRFEADPAEIASILARYGEPVTIFHTHPNGSRKASNADRAQFYYPHSTILIGIVENGRLKLS